MYWFWDSTMILILPALILAFWAQAKMRSTFTKYSRIGTHTGMTGAEAARRILDQAGVFGLKIEHVRGNLSDHYDPRTGVLRLSDGVFGQASIAAIGVAAHEAGHAIQHSEGWFPIKARNAIVPIANLGSSAAFPLFIAGLIFRAQPLMQIGILFFAAAVVFHLITLPVEIDASRRAIVAIEGANILDQQEIKGAKKVLTAAAMTYVASTLMALLNLLRMILLSRSR